MKNFMIFIFSYKARLNLAYTFIALNILQVLLGCVMTIASIYICLSVTKYLYAEKAEIQFVFTVFGIFGSYIIFQYLVGIKVVEFCFVKAHKRSTKRNLYFWLFLCCNTIIDLLILATLIVRISKHIVRSIRHSMEKGMRHYLSDPVWKHTIDRWQFSLRCCGVNNFQDWYKISWLDKYHINVDSSTVQSLLLSKDHLHLPITPWSCCDITFPMQCFHDPLQQIDTVHVWREQPDVPEMSLYRNGCLEIIRYPIEMCLIWFLVICIVLFFVQIFIIIISRFLYTSCRNAVILHNCTGKAPGWLFTRDCLAEKRGRTLSEMMFEMASDSQSSYETTEENEDDEDDDDMTAETNALLKAITPPPHPPQNRINPKASPATTHSSHPPPISTRKESLLKHRSNSRNKTPYRPLRPHQSSHGHVSKHPSAHPHHPPPHVPPRKESQINPNPSKRKDSQRSMNVSSLVTDPAMSNKDYDVHYTDARWHQRLDYVMEQDEPSECEICYRDSARNPVSRAAEDMLMLG